jgi:hypothetical protein
MSPRLSRVVLSSLADLPLAYRPNPVRQSFGGSAKELKVPYNEQWQ